MKEDSEFKANYFDHLRTMNPGGTNKGTYRANLFYYKAVVLPIFLADTNGRVSDVGCGFRHMIRFLLEHGYRRAGGVEIDGQLNHASSEYVGKKAEFFGCDDVFRALKNQEEAFDVTITLNFIEYFATRRHLRSGPSHP